MLALMLALSLPPRPRPALIQDATVLAAAELERLDGRVVRVRAESLHNAWEGIVGLDGPTTDGWAAEWDGGAEGPVMLEGRLSVLQHRAGFIGATWFPGFVEFRLTKARVVR